MSNDLLEEFIFDSREHLATAANQLLALEKEPGSLANLNALMGTLHTIKGNSGFVDLRNLYALLHASENLLQTVRENANHECSAQIIDQLFQVLDTAEAIMARLENGENDEVDWLPTLNQAISELEVSLEKEAKSSSDSLSETGTYSSEPELEASSELSAARPIAKPMAPATVLLPENKEEPVVDPTELSGQCQVLTLSDGQLAGDSQFVTSCCNLFQRGLKGLIIDLSGITQFTSQEMNALVSVHNSHGEHLAFVLDPVVQPDFYRVFQVLSLDNVFIFYSEPKTALSALGNA